MEDRMELQDLPYIDIQHDTLSVFDDVEQAVVLSEDIWVSAYQSGKPSVHGKAKVQFEEGGGSSLTSRAGVKVERVTRVGTAILASLSTPLSRNVSAPANSHTEEMALISVSKINFLVSVPQLGLQKVPVNFPRQVIHPPYEKAGPLAPPLHVNAIAYSPTGSQVVVGGPDGYCAILPTGGEKGEVMLKGHVGDVLDARWFPSGEVVLTASSDLSVRVFDAKAGVNPRTLRGHTKAVTSLAIIGVGKQVLSGSKDGTVRLWDVGAGKEVRKWETDGRRAIEAVILVEDAGGRRALGGEEEERLIIAASQGGWSIFPWSSKGRGRLVENPVESHLVSMTYDPGLGLIATGHTNGIIVTRRIEDFNGGAKTATLVRRNESPIYSLVFTPSSETGEVDLLVGTAAGLPCRLGVRPTEDGLRIWVKEEYAGWEAVGVESSTVEKDGRGVWCAGGEGGLRRY